MLAEDEEWFENFIKDYKAKLAEEKHQLITAAALVTARNQQTSPDVGQQQPDDTICATSNCTPEVTPPFKHNVTLLTEKQPVLETIVDDVAERKRKQQEYRRVLDQQLEEQRQRKLLQEKNYRKLILEEDEVPSTQLDSERRTIVRSPSPPIKSHYRNVVQFRVPSRPLTANSNQQRLSDLTELRQLYSNR